MQKKKGQLSEATDEWFRERMWWVLEQDKEDKKLNKAHLRVKALAIRKLGLGEEVPEKKLDSLFERYISRAVEKYGAVVKEELKKKGCVFNTGRSRKWGPYMGFYPKTQAPFKEMYVNTASYYEPAYLEVYMYPQWFKKHAVKISGVFDKILYFEQDSEVMGKRYITTKGDVLHVIAAMFEPDVTDTWYGGYV